MTRFRRTQVRCSTGMVAAAGMLGLCLAGTGGGAVGPTAPIEANAVTATGSVHLAIVNDIALIKLP